MNVKQLVAAMLIGTALLTSCSGPTTPSGGTSAQSPSDTSEPSISTQEDVTLPVQTEAETTPSIKPIKESGTLQSSESETLILRADWTAVSTDGKTATVTVKVGLICYDISVGNREGSISVKGKAQAFTTQMIEHKVDERKSFDFVTKEFTVELNEDGEALLELDVTWSYNQKYDGQSITDLVISAKLPFPSTARLEVETDTAPADRLAESSPVVS